MASQLLFFLCSSQGVASPFLSCSMAGKEEKDTTLAGLCFENTWGCFPSICCTYQRCADAAAICFSCWACGLFWQQRKRVMSWCWQKRCCRGSRRYDTVQKNTRTQGTHSLSLVGRGFFSFVSVFFSFVLSKRAISVMSGLSDILAGKGAKKETRFDLICQASLW